jgi:hypothetical protein
VLHNDLSSRSHPCTPSKRARDEEVQYTWSGVTIHHACQNVLPGGLSKAVYSHRRSVQHLLGVACDLPSTCYVRVHRPPTRDHMSASYCGPDCAHSRHALPMDRSTRKTRRHTLRSAEGWRAARRILEEATKTKQALQHSDKSRSSAFR